MTGVFAEVVGGNLLIGRPGYIFGLIPHRAFDNIFVERLLRSVKYEEVYLKDYRTVSEARDGLHQYFPFYNEQRIHQALDYRTPHHVHFAGP